MCAKLSDLFDNGYSIIVAEVLIFSLIMVLIIYRLGDRQSMSKDLERIEKFLDKIDDETLIKLCEIDQRSDKRVDNIKKNVDRILKSKHFIEENKNNRKVREHMRRIDQSFLNIFRSAVAIRSRNDSLLDESKRKLIDKIDKIIRERDNI